MHRTPAFVLSALLSLLIITAPGLAQAAGDDAALEERVRRILAETPLIDGHNDTPIQYRSRVAGHITEMDFNSDLSGGDRPMQTDIPRLREGGVGGQFWSVYIPINNNRGGRDGDARRVLQQIDLTKRLVAAHPRHLAMAYTAADVERIHASGRIASLLGMEGGHSIENSLAVLRATYDAGARYMGLTHSKNTLWADSATDVPAHDGLTKFGEEVVREMNRLGMLVDLAHVSPATMHDALDVSRSPVIFSHSSAFAVCQHVRNVPDDVLRRMPENGGVVMVTFLGFYVSEPLRLWSVARDAEQQRLVIKHAEDRAAIDEGMAAWNDANPRPDATVEQVADHIEHVRDVAGIEYVGIGGDYDGTSSLPLNMEDVSSYPLLLKELCRRGWSDADLKALIGENVLRVMRDNERIAEDLQRVEPARDGLIEELDGEIETRGGGRRGW